MVKGGRTNVHVFQNVKGYFLHVDGGQFIPSTSLERFTLKEMGLFSPGGI